MRPIDIIGILAIIITFYFIFKKILWNFNNEHALRISSNIFSFIITAVISTSLMFVSFKLQIILTIIMYVSIIVFYKYIDDKNRTKNKDNNGLQAFYISELKETKSTIICGASIVFVMQIIRLLCFQS